MKHGWILAILALALAVRLALLGATTRETAFTPDSEGYWRLAGNLLQRGQFALDDRPEIFRTPGYPAFLMIGHLSAGDVRLERMRSRSPVTVAQSNVSPAAVSVVVTRPR